MPTLSELLQESLESKLADQIEMALVLDDIDKTSEEGSHGINEATNYSLKLEKKFSKKVFKTEIPEWKNQEVDQFLKKYFNVGVNELDKLNYIIVSDAAFNRKYIKYKTYIDGCSWTPTGSSDRVDLYIWENYPDKILFGSFHIPGNYKKVVILGTIKELTSIY